jgi:hypothetical protein
MWAWPLLLVAAIFQPTTVRPDTDGQLRLRLRSLVAAVKGLQASGRAFRTCLTRLPQPPKSLGQPG